jgi:hypothetical protein
MLSPSRRLRVLFILLLTLIVLVSPSAWARGGGAVRNEQPAKVSKPSPPDLLGRAWTLLTGLWAKEGCGIDPDGHCTTRPTAPAPVVPEQVDTGCGIDPDGRCHS